jgi:gentisate 1,2-dioxygenase
MAETTVKSKPTDAATQRDAKSPDMYMELVRFGQEENVRRKESPVLVTREFYEEALPTSESTIFMIDPRLGFNNRTHRFWINRLPPGGEEGQAWKTLGHRHTVEAVIYWLEGHGYSIIDGVRHDWKAGDIICVPMFAWHRHVNQSEGSAYYVASTTGPLSMGIGQAVYEDERYPQYFMFAQQGEEAMKAMTPGGATGPDSLKKTALSSEAQRCYAEQVSFAFHEEERRKQSKVIFRGEDVKLESTVMGNMAYVVDARLGFHVKALCTLIAEVPPGRHSGAHRHLYDEINFVLEGEGKVVIDDETYLVRKGDALCIPVFAWHQYFSTGDKPLRLLVHSTRPAMENLGLVLTQHGENADY